MTDTDKKIRVLTVDDHPLMREGINAVLESEPDIILVAEAANGQQAIEQFRQHQPDVTLMDLQMPDMSGLEAIDVIRSEYPSARIIVLTTYNGDVQAFRAIKAGAMGYLLKSMAMKELASMIRSVHAGKRCVPSEIAAELAEHAGNDRLSDREIEVLRLVAMGNANKQVAAQLNITEETVKAHMSNILGKLGARDRTHAFTIALKRGFLTT
jgi:DNA-binding NarL/FixJ family response regulator